MGFWSWLKGESAAESGVEFNPGDPDGVEFTGGASSEFRSLPAISPSPWDGWPASWGTSWSNQSGLDKLVDTAWTCIDKNANALASFPAYRLRGGQVARPEPWMVNPDPTIYGSWFEFAKEMVWDFHLGEVFIRAVTRYKDGWPATFRVVPPWAVEVELGEFGRQYRIGGRDVTNDILHIRYKSSTGSARGVGPLEAGGARMTAAGVLARYVEEVVRTGGVALRTLETDQELDEGEADDLLHQWVTARQMHLAAPPVLDRNVKLVDHPSVSPKDLAMLEVAQFTEARIAVLLGMPPPLVGLPTGDSFTYSNVSSWFDHHDRSHLRPVATALMSALSAWLLPRGSTVELNRDEYSRPPFNERADAYVKLVAAGIMTVEEVRQMERLTGDAPARALGGVTE